MILCIGLLAITSFQLWATKDRTAQPERMEAIEDKNEPQLGGDFTLTNQNGVPAHASDYAGHITLVFFGFTHCPDICPVTVSTLSKTMELLGANADQVTPLFITIDPDRDTPAVLKEFLQAFDKRIVGLTGNAEQVKQVADSYKVYYTKAQSEQAKNPLVIKEPDYTLDHSGYVYMMGKDGKFLRIFPYNVPEQELAHAVETALR